MIPGSLLLCVSSPYAIAVDARDNPRLISQLCSCRSIQLSYGRMLEFPIAYRTCRYQKLGPDQTRPLREAEEPTMTQGIPCQETKVPEVGRLTSPLRAAPCQLNSPAGPRSPEVESLCGSALVSMVKPAAFRHGDNPAQFRRFNRSSIWTVLPKRKMTPRGLR